MPKDHTLEFENNDLAALLFGEHNTHISYLEQKLGISIADKGNQLRLMGADKDVETAERVLLSLLDKIKNKQEVGIAEIDAALRFLNEDQNDVTDIKDKDETSSNKTGQNIVIQTKKKSISPRSPNQAHYIQMIQKNSMVFGLGPAGTGKTYLAVAVGAAMFLNGDVERLIFTRPAVEAGEHLGFLPGDMKDKVDPYLRPIYDAMHDMMPWDFMMKKMEAGDIEVAPLAFMRGRTLSNAFVILDEAQNTTTTQMKMFLTRMGESSRMVITGDISQTDLPGHQKSGLVDAVDTLGHVDEIKFMRFSKGDVTRHPLVSKIVQAYDEKDHK